MSVDIHCYTETLNDAKQWEADNANTFEMATASGNDPWPEMIPNFTNRDYGLFGMLAMGVKTSYPFSFAQRGFPKNASKEIITLTF